MSNSDGQFTLSLSSFSSVSASTSLILTVIKSSSSFCMSEDLPSHALRSFFGVAMMSETTFDWLGGGGGASCLCSWMNLFQSKYTYNTNLALLTHWISQPLTE